VVVGTGRQHGGMVGVDRHGRLVLLVLGEDVVVAADGDLPVTAMGGRGDCRADQRRYQGEQPSDDDVPSIPHGTPPLGTGQGPATFANHVAIDKPLVGLGGRSRQVACGPHPEAVRSRNSHYPRSGCAQSCAVTPLCYQRTGWVGDHVTVAPEAVTMWGQGGRAGAAWRGLAVPESQYGSVDKKGWGHEADSG